MTARLFIMAVGLMRCTASPQGWKEVVRAIACVPVASSSPPVFDQFVSFVVGTDGLGVILNGSEWLSDMLGRHENGAILRIAEIPG